MSETLGHQAKTPPRPARACRSKTACLLMHGYAGSPFEMEPLVPGLEGLGCDVDLPTLPGHDTSINDFRQTFFPDWLGHIRERLLILQECHDQVILIGFSMGGAIALSLAAEHAPAAAVALSPPWQAYRLFPLKRHSWLALTPLLKYFRPEIPLPPPKPESRAIAPFKGYDGPLCLPQLHSLEQGVRAMRGLLPKLACPLLMLYDLNDRVCPPDFALSIARATSSQDICMRMTRMRETVTSHHMITTHRDTRQIVIAEVNRFVRSIQEKGTTLPL